jgi:predicted thioredoxin/glutaredoxin
MSEKYYQITSLHKKDIIKAFEDTEHEETIEQKVSEMTDEDMEHLANKLSDDYCEHMFWDSLRTIFESEYLK